MTIADRSLGGRTFATVRCRRPILIAVALLSALAHLGATDAPGKPRRIVSLNMCVDELVLRLAEPQNIASVTWLSRDPKNSNVAELGAGIAVNHGLAEEIIPLNPDLVIAGIYTARPAVAMLKRVGIPVLEVGIPQEPGRRPCANPRNRRADRRAGQGRKRHRRHGPTPRGAAAPVAVGPAAGRGAQSERRDRGQGRHWSTRS